MASQTFALPRTGTSARRPNSDVAKLRGQVWLSHAVWLSGLTFDEFARRYVYEKRARSGLVSKWRRGDASPSAHSVRRVTGRGAEARRTFEHPVFALLKNEYIPAATVWRLLAKLLPEDVVSTNGARTGVHQLRGLCELRPRACRLNLRPFRAPVWLPPDSWQLKCRPSLDSLAKLLGLLRAAEAGHYWGRHRYWAQETFRMLPAALQNAWLGPHLEKFVDLVEIVRERVPGSGSGAFEIDRGMLRAQLGRPGFRPLYRDGQEGFDPVRTGVLWTNDGQPFNDISIELRDLV